MTPGRTLVVVVLLIHAFAAAAPPGDLLARADAAYRAGDFVRFLDEMLSAYRAAPDDARVIYNLSCAHALNGQADQAIALLERLSDRNVAHRADVDADFDAIRSSRGFREALARNEEVRRATVVRIVGGASPATAAAALAPPAFVRVQVEKDATREAPAAGPDAPEASEGSVVALPLGRFATRPDGMAYDRRRNRFLLGAGGEAHLVEVTARGLENHLIPADEEGFAGAFALAIDERRDWLWVAARTGEGGEARPSILSYELEGLRLVGTYRPEGAPAEHRFADLALDRSGSLFVVDRASGALFRILRTKNRLEPVPAAGTFDDPRAIALADDGRYLFVAHRAGISVVDLDRSRRWELGNPAKAPLTGLERLFVHERALVALDPERARVVKIGLDRGFRRAERFEVAQDLAALGDPPTAGAVVSNELFVAAGAPGRPEAPGRCWLLRVPLGGRSRPRSQPNPLPGLPPTGQPGPVPSYPAG